MDRHRRLRWVVLVALALVAVACGGDDGGGGEAAPSGAQVTSGADGDARASDDIARAQGSGEIGLVSAVNDRRGEGGPPKRGGVLTVDWPSDIGTIDPITSSSFQTHSRIGPVYETLFSFDTGPDIGATQQVLVPRLAESLDISADGLTYTITLRQGVNWQNVAPVNGRPFTSDDVKITFDTIKTEGFQSYMLERVTAVEAPDAATVVLRLSAPFAPLENYLANHHMWILPREAFEGGYDRAQTAIGTGPFKMVGRQVDVETTYERNENYWKTDEAGEQLPYLDGLRLVIIKDTQAAAAAFRAAQTDISWTALSPEENALMQRQYPDAQYFSWLDAGMGQVGINMERPIFADERVREAVTLAIDRQGMGETIRGGGTVPSVVAPALADYTLPEEERRNLLGHDPTRAKQLLAEAGHPNGLEVNLIATTGYGSLYNRQTQWLIEDLTRAGFVVRYDELDYTTYFSSRWPDQEYDLQFGPQTPFLEPDEWLRSQLYSSGARNWYGIDDPQLDTMLEGQLEEIDQEKRVELIKEIQRYALDRLVAPIPVWTYLREDRYQPWVRNYYRHASYGMLGIEYAWLDK